MEEGFYCLRAKRFGSSSLAQGIVSTGYGKDGVKLVFYELDGYSQLIGWPVEQYKGLRKMTDDEIRAFYQSNASSLERLERIHIEDDEIERRKDTLRNNLAHITAYASKFKKEHLLVSPAQPQETPFNGLGAKLEGVVV